MLLFLVRRILVGIPGEALTIDNELDGVSWLNIIINKFEREREREREREKERKKERKKEGEKRKKDREMRLLRLPMSGDTFLFFFFIISVRQCLVV